MRREARGRDGVGRIQEGARRSHLGGDGLDARRADLRSAAGALVWPRVLFDDGGGVREREKRRRAKL